mmetsp:Transcript_14000/g.28190  ORF Transcript_14000/g.28190 Transcript_14000/m.28190 type:complete len:509 (-) Transcript_14000:527-2053(-)
MLALPVRGPAWLRCDNGHEKLAPKSYRSDLDCQSGRAESTKIVGVGRNFNRDLGKKSFRTACSIYVDASLESTVATLRRKLREALEDPESTTRLMVQGDRYWYSDAPAEAIVDDMLLVEHSKGGKLACEMRFRDGRGDSPMLAAYCVCEPYSGTVRSAADVEAGVGAGEALGKATTVSWLFRHDVIDGWRVLRYLCSLIFESSPLTYTKLRERNEENKRRDRERGAVMRLCRSLGRACGAVALSPMACLRLGQIGCRAEMNEDGRQFYLHAVVNLSRLKEIGAAHGLGGISTTLTACIAAAYFAADSTRQYATVGQNILFEPDTPVGNHVCVKVVSLRRPPVVELDALHDDSGDLKEGGKPLTYSDSAAGPHPSHTDAVILTDAGRAMNAASQGLVDLLLGNLTRQYVKGELPSSMSRAIEQRHNSMDFLVSNLPAFNATQPRVFDLQTMRESSEWAPSIIYVIGIGETLFCDFYFTVRPTFSIEGFIKAFQRVSGAENVHTTLAGCY